MELKELKDKILEALYSALPITVLVYLMALTPWFEFSTVELITFTAGAVLLVLGSHDSKPSKPKEYVSGES